MGSHSEQTPQDRLVIFCFLLTTTRTQFEREANPLAVITTNNTQWDAFGNVTETVEPRPLAFDPQQIVTITAVGKRLDVSYHASGGYSHWNGADTLIADTITLYDKMQQGSISAQGLVMKSSALALSDELVTRIYGNNVPDFAAFGYYRRPNEDGWWIHQASMAAQRMRPDYTVRSQVRWVRSVQVCLPRSQNVSDANGGHRGLDKSGAAPLSNLSHSAVDRRLRNVASCHFTIHSPGCRFVEPVT